jgi:hypothetical protein
MALKVCHPAMQAMLTNEAPVFGHSLRLYQNNYVITRDTILSDLVEATFNGYAAINPTWGSPFQNGVEDVIAGSVSTFTAGGGLIGPQTIYGYYFLDNVGNYSWGETFPGGPTTIAVIGQQLVIYPQLKMANYGDE